MSILLTLGGAGTLGGLASGCAMEEATGEEVRAIGAALQFGRAYTLENVYNGLCVDVEGWSTSDGGNIFLWDCHDGANQQWTFQDAGGGYVLIKSVHSGKCLDVWAWSTEGGANIAQYSCHGGENQQFRVEDVANGGVVRIVSRLSGMALDAWAWGASAGTNVAQWAVTGADNQKFYASLSTGSTGGGSTGGGSTGGGSTGGGSTSSGCSSVSNWGQVDSTIVVEAGQTFDGNCRRYWAGPGVGDGSQSESQDPVFRLENGAVLRNVVIGSPAADGVHTYGNVTLENVTWEDVGEDALTIKDSGTVTLNGGSASNGEDKIFQINAASTFRLSNFTARNAGKLIRQNGGTTYRVDVFIDRCDISDMDEAIFRTDSSSSRVTMTNTRYSDIGDSLFLGVSPSNISTSNNTEY